MGGAGRGSLGSAVWGVWGRTSAERKVRYAEVIVIVISIEGWLKTDESQSTVTMPMARPHEAPTPAMKRKLKMTLFSGSACGDGGEGCEG